MEKFYYKIAESQKTTISAPYRYQYSLPLVKSSAPEAESRALKWQPMLIYMLEIESEICPRFKKETEVKYV